jgi:tetratricopeptide (TPR) repeat protein
MIWEMIAATAMAALLAATWEPAAPARFEPLFRRHWETQRTAAAARDYGLFLARIGDRETAARVLRRSAELEESSETLEALASLVPPAEALRHYERALVLRPSGDLYRKTATLLEAQGKLALAQQRYREALAAYEKQLGPQHPKVAVVLNDVALLLENRRDFKGAEKLYRRALGIQEKAFGTVHPEVGTTLNNLGGAVGAAGKLEEAEPLLRRALSVFQQTLGPRHARLAVCSANLADLLAALERSKEAAELYAQAASIYEELGDARSAAQAREASAKLR